MGRQAEMEQLRAHGIKAFTGCGADRHNGSVVFGQERSLQKRLEDCGDIVQLRERSRRRP